MSELGVVELFKLAHADDRDGVLAALTRCPSYLDEKEPLNRWTVLHIASRLSNHVLVSELLHRGADSEERDAMFRSALHLAARADAMRTLVTGSGVSSCEPPCGEQLVPDAKVETLRVLLRAGARVTARDQFGFTALHHAAQAGHVLCIEFLLSLNISLRLPRAQIEAETNAEERPLHLAAAGGHEDAVRCLLEHGAHPVKSNYIGQTPLHLAVAAGDAPSFLATVRLLCAREWRVDLNAASRKGRTALHDAAAAGHDKVVKALMIAPNIARHGGSRTVDLLARDCSGSTPQQLALACGFYDVARMIDERIAELEAKAACREQEERDALRASMQTLRVDCADKRVMETVPEMEVNE
uniref:Uncharacterized protein n=1 Tax=Calcidiscus leptoporus TaxID=127549 RepID=A0A7S0ITV3_9EUKA|mmetsp:Transcript_21762/g.50056  ORF Transcript_21762/g.50056 Transcript_21762/m.50056 type:complete len:356 (+) Transcript_21762:34-1101(+)